MQKLAIVIVDAYNTNMNRYDVVAIHLLLESNRGSYSDEFWEVPGRCLPCREGCTVCNDDTPCLAQEDTALRLAMVSFQGFCMLMDFISMLVVYHFRRNKVCAPNITFSHFCKTIYNCPNTQLLLNHSKIFSKHGIIYYSVGLNGNDLIPFPPFLFQRIRASGLILVEAILSGSVLLYFPVSLNFFIPKWKHKTRPVHIT